MAAEWVRPYQQSYLDQSQNLSQTPYTQFGNRTAGANGMQQNAWQAMYNRGQQGSQEVSAARDQLTGTIKGDGFTNNPFMGQSNPYLQQQIDSTTSDMRRNYEQTLPSMSSRAARGDTFGGAKAGNYEAERERNFGDSVGKTISNFRFGDYQNQQGMYEKERDRQMQSTALAPQFSQVDYNDINAMQSAGNNAQTQNQNEINGNLAGYNDARDWTFRTNQAFGQALGNGGGYQATPEAPRPNRGANFLGGAGLGYQATGSGWGALGGGLLSLL
jgi:hypothetical protein